MTNIPEELYEAATIDGASGIGQFRRITLPLLGPTTFFPGDYQHDFLLQNIRHDQVPDERRSQLFEYGYRVPDL
ncbi:hypothetical protein ACFTAO_14205 [Paenibacillus rhizoplanae]